MKGKSFFLGGGGGGYFLSCWVYFFGRGYLKRFYVSKLVGFDNKNGLKQANTAGLIIGGDFCVGVLGTPLDGHTHWNRVTYKVRVAYWGRGNWN